MAVEELDGKNKPMDSEASASEAKKALFSRTALGR